MNTLFNITAEISCYGGIKYNMSQFKDAVKQLSRPDKRNVRILIIDDFQDFTLKQLKYYHGILLSDVCQAYESIGYSMNTVEADKEMREMFLFYYKTHLPSGRSSKIVLTLDTDSPKFPTTKDMSKFFEDIVQHCAINMSFVIQLPDDIKDNNLDFNRTEKN